MAIDSAIERLWEIYEDPTCRKDPSRRAALRRAIRALNEKKESGNDGVAGPTPPPRKCYIAGKITGDGNYREKFKTAERALQGEGYIVLNPAELPEGMLPGDYMRICLAMLETSDVVAMLPDWKNSRGANVEFMYAQYTAHPVLFLEHLDFYKAATAEREAET